MTVPYWDKKHKETYSTADWAHKPSIFAEQIRPLLPASGKLLEVGTGQGGDAKFFCDSGFTVVATDYSNEAILSASSRIEGVEFLQIDTAEGLPFPSESFDVAYSHLALHYFDADTTNKIFKEIHRLLKPGGILATLTNSTDDPEVKEFSYIKLEEDFYQDPSGIKKRYFSVGSMRNLVAGLFSPLLLDNQGATYKDQEPNLIRFVGQKI